MGELPRLELGGGGEGPGEMRRLVAEAFAAYGKRQVQKAAGALSAAETAARRAGLHHDASQIRKAIGILAQGGKPRLLTRADYLDGRK